MPTTPTPETPGSLDERVRDHREALTVLMAGTGRCEDIVSGATDGPDECRDENGNPVPCP